MKYYEVQSGRPAGEVYHREIVVATSEKAAKKMVAAWQAAIDAGKFPAVGKWEAEQWRWGPSYYERDGNPAECTTWDGFRMSPARVVGP